MSPDDNDDLPGDETTPAPEADKKPATQKQPAAEKRPQPKPEPDPEPEPEPKRHRHTQKLVTLALSMGFSQEDLDNHDSDTIWKEIERMDMIAARRREAERKPEPEKKGDPEPDEDEEFIAQLEKDADLDPRYPKFLRRLLAKAKATGEVEELKKKVAEFEKRESEREHERHVRALDKTIDEAFAKLAKDFNAVDLIGAGPMRELDDPGHKGWRNQIFADAGIEKGDSLAVIRSKLLRAGEARLRNRKGSKQQPAEPPKKQPARASNGQYTESDYAEGVLPAPSNRRTGEENLSGAAVLHQFFRDKGDSRGEGEFVDADDNDDLPELG